MLIPVLVGVSLTAFLILHLAPGDPARLMAGVEASQEDVDMLRHKFGLDRPLPVQYAMFVKGLFTGELMSLRFESPAMEIILPKLKNTLILACASIVVAVVLGVTAGVLSATHRKSWIDYTATILSLFGISMPVFW